MRPDPFNTLLPTGGVTIVTVETISTNRSYGGVQGVYKHASRETGTDMTFSVYVPPFVAAGAKLPVVWYLSGLTCTHANVTEKGEFRRSCAELGLVFVAPDTSPRGENVPGDPAGVYDFGLGAGFYVDATQAPFTRNYRMWSYLTEELPGLIAAHFPVDLARQSILGHSMGGHGALTIALRHSDRYRAASAFSPIVAPSRVPWGTKALSGYLGDRREEWRKHDTVALIEDGARFPDFLVDYGSADPFLTEQLRPELLESACAKAGISLNLRRQDGYDHSYYFISTFMDDHIRWHADRLKS
jgi:S-formylglutathione hydrolase